MIIWKQKGSLALHRMSTVLYFLIVGVIYASWTSRIPEIKALYEFSNSSLGTLLFVQASGAMLSMPVTGWLNTRIGSHWTCRVTSVILCICISLLILYPSVTYLGIMFFLLGFFSGSLDVSMNSQAVAVERLWNSSIMSSFHGVFSVGMAIGAGISAMFVSFDVSLKWHLAIIGLISIFISVWADFNTIKEPVTKDESKEDDGFRFPTLAIIPIGLVAFCGMTGEGSMVDWSALFMKDVVGADETFGALTIGAFATAMTIGRFLGDYFTDRWGRVKMLVYSSLLAILGLSLVLTIMDEGVVLLGFFLVGLGLATVVPIVFSAAGNTKGVSPSVGIAMASAIGYTGFFVGPPVIGYLADAYGLRIALTFSLTLLVVMFVLILTMRKRI